MPRKRKVPFADECALPASNRPGHGASEWASTQTLLWRFKIRVVLPVAWRVSPVQSVFGPRLAPQPGRKYWMCCNGVRPDLIGFGVHATKAASVVQGTAF